MRFGLPFGRSTLYLCLPQGRQRSQRRQAGKSLEMEREECESAFSRRHQRLKESRRKKCGMAYPAPAAKAAQQESQARKCLESECEECESAFSRRHQFRNSPRAQPGNRKNKRAPDRRPKKTRYKHARFERCFR